MEVTRLENLPPPPGIISSIRAGFDSIASHITAILLPLFLNLFFWLGPRLRINVLFDSFKDDMIRIWQNGGIPAEEIQRVITAYDTALPAFNLFWLFRTLPIGISSLPLSRQLLPTPLGEPIAWQANGWILFFAFFGLTFLGWLGGALYFRSVAWVAVPSENGVVSVFNAILQTILISIFCTILLMIFAPILSLILLFLSSQNIIITSLVILVLSFVSMWFIVPIFFLPHGVFVKKQNIFTAIGSSIQLTRFTLPNSSMFVLTVFLLSYGLNVLWRIPPESSWLTLLAIFGHSFVTTALLAGSFIYYRDMTTWLQTVLEKLRPLAKQA
ncbi:MAG: hypothetical protein JNM46_03200 [Anaerolineales bacterium]|nr:hypothetical protein [Anaerolineales bacterium]